MAGDWIKMRVDLADDPAIIGMASALKTSEDDIVGKMHRLWSWANKHTATGFVPHISERWIDKHVGKNGFSKALCSVGWLSIDSTGITFPNFDRHNGESAKSRALKTQSQATWRAKNGTFVDRHSSTTASTTASTSDSTAASTKFSTREEKRRDSKPAIGIEDYTHEGNASDSQMQTSLVMVGGRWHEAATGEEVAA